LSIQKFCGHIFRKRLLIENCLHYRKRLLINSKQMNQQCLSHSINDKIHKDNVKENLFYLGGNMSQLKSAGWIFGILGIIIGAFAQAFIEKYLAPILPMQIIPFISIFLVIIIAAILIGFLSFLLKKINHSIDQVRQEFISIFKGKYYTTFIENQTERHKKLIDCIHKAEEEILIFSDLASMDEIRMKEHKQYLDELNYILKNRKSVKVTRFVVPNPGDEKLESDADIINWVKRNRAYAEHFEILNKYRERALLALRNSGPTGLSIILVDERYLFLVIEKEYEEKLLGQLMAGGFFFEDFGKSLTRRYKECLENLKIGIIEVI